MPKTALRFDLPDSAATEGLGAALARGFPGESAGAVVHLRGELGSGKTTCVRSLLHALGVAAPVQTTLEVEELGLRDMTGPGYLMLIEWPEKGGAAVPLADLHVQLLYAGDARAAHLKAASDTGAVWLDKLAIDTSLNLYVSNLT
jgi:tRNA threonylcarbamoyladenosine biosynthesis protein TsaE